jgi:hypothetical protein
VDYFPEKTNHHIQNQRQRSMGKNRNILKKINRILKNDGEKITTESGIANELTAQFAKTSSTENYPKATSKRRKKQQKK